MEACHIGKEGSGNSFSSSSVLQMDDVQHLTEPVYNHQQANISIGHGNGHEVHCNITPWDARHGYWLQESTRVCVLSLGALTDVTGGDILLDPLRHPWEPIFSSESGEGSGDAHMPGMVMIGLQ